MLGPEGSVEDKNVGQARSWAGLEVRCGAGKPSPALAVAAAVAFEPFCCLPDCQSSTFVTAWEGVQGSHGNRAKNLMKKGGGGDDEIESGPEIKIANS